MSTNLANPSARAGLRPGPAGPVLVTDGDARAALAVARSLVARGHQVHVVASRSRSLAGVSRGVREHVVTPDPMAAPSAYAAAVVDLAREIRASVLLPVTDAAATAILDRPHPALSTCRVPLPPFAAFHQASDKAALLPLAEAAGFAVPESILIAAPAEAPPDVLNRLTPGVLKPHRSIGMAEGALRRYGVVPYVTAAAGAALLRAMPPGAFPVLAQRRIEGPGVGFFALRWEGRLVATFAHRRVREVPPSGGVSVCRESIAMPPALRAAGERLLAALSWEGVAMVECKHDLASDRYYVIEINPRFWGSLQLAVDAGVDFPSLLIDCALGATPPPVTDYRVGLRTRWGWGELDYVYLRAKFRPVGASVVGALLSALAEVVRWSPRRDRVEIFRLRDPLPFVVETLRRLGVMR